MIIWWGFLCYSTSTLAHPLFWAFPTFTVCHSKFGSSASFRSLQKRWTRPNHPRNMSALGSLPWCSNPLSQESKLFLFPPYVLPAPWSGILELTFTCPLSGPAGPLGYNLFPPFTGPALVLRAHSSCCSGCQEKQWGRGLTFSCRASGNVPSPTVLPTSAGSATQRIRRV